MSKHNYFIQSKNKRKIDTKMEQITIEDLEKAMELLKHLKKTIKKLETKLKVEEALNEQWRTYFLQNKQAPEIEKPKQEVKLEFVSKYNKSKTEKEVKNNGNSTNTGQNI